MRLRIFPPPIGDSPIQSHEGTVDMQRQGIIRVWIPAPVLRSRGTKEKDGSVRSKRSAVSTVPALEGAAGKKTATEW